MKGLPSGFFAHLAQLAVIIWGRAFENSKCSGGKKEEGRHLWETEVPLMGKGVLGGATYQLHKCLTNMSSPPHIFSQISTPESKRKLLVRNLFRKCFKMFYPIPSLFVFQNRGAAFLMIVGRVEEITWSVSWPAHQRQSVNREFLNAQTTNICSHRATEWEKNKNKQEEKRENRSRS